MTSRLAYAVAGEISILAQYIDQAEGADERHQIIQLVGDRLDLLVYYEEGQSLEGMPRDQALIGWASMLRDTLSAELIKQLTYPFVVYVDFKEKWVEVRVQLKEGVVNISLPQRRLFSSSSYIFLIWVFSASFVLLVIAVLFMRNQVRPIRRLAIAAERFGKGRDVQDFKLEGAKEVRRAGQAFLNMRTRIQRQISQRTEMLAGVSHDLRTPLTRLKLGLAMLGGGPDVEAMKSDIQDMEKMIDGYLDFVRGEGHEVPVSADLNELLEQVVIGAKRQGQNVFLDMESETVWIPLRSMAFKRCLGNLLSNASKYAPHIWVTMRCVEGARIEIRVEDDGPGIPAEQHDDVFRPFYRLDSSRNTETGGVGLGLPIAMDIVHSHGGKIWLEESAYGGLSVIIRLPL